MSKGTLEFVVGNSPEELVAALASLPYPFLIVAIVPQGVRHVAYISREEVSKPKIKAIKGV